MAPRFGGRAVVVCGVAETPVGAAGGIAAAVKRDDVGR
jgi:hypothetical protein